MVKKIIILGELNKKHFLPLLLAIYQIVNKINNRYYPAQAGNIVLTMYSLSLGMMSILFLPCIFKLKVNEGEKEKEIKKRKWLHYPLLIIIYWSFNIIKALVIATKFISKQKKPEKAQTMNPLADGPFAFIGIEMILLTVTSIILLKYKYFIHHIISMVGFILFGNFSDLLLGSYPEIILFGAIPIIIQIVNIILDVIYYYYQKYMMEKLFYPYWNICFTLGIGLFIFSTANLIYVLVHFTMDDIGLKIGKIILSYIISIISNILYILNIYYFNPNYVLISFQFSKIADVLINENGNNKYFCIIFFVIQLFFLMIYLEIIELNFCDLNKNTKKNIEFRSVLEASGQSGRDSSVGLGVVDINKDYSVNLPENIKNNDKNIELLSEKDNEDMH